eukprot:5666439-Alexandrium_andersonii.AAC.1
MLGRDGAATGVFLAARMFVGATNLREATCRPRAAVKKEPQRQNAIILSKALRAASLCSSACVAGCVRC